METTVQSLKMLSHLKHGSDSNNEFVTIYPLISYLIEFSRNWSCSTSLSRFTTSCESKPPLFIFKLKPNICISNWLSTNLSHKNRYLIRTRRSVINAWRIYSSLKWHLHTTDRYRLMLLYPESDVCRRQILTYKIDPRTVRVKIFIMAVDP